MDKNQLIGMILICAILIAYNYLWAPKIINIKQPLTTILTPPPNSTPANSGIANGLENPKLQQNVPSNTLDGIEKTTIIENEVFRITLSTLGGRIKEVLLKKYLGYDNKPLILLGENSSSMGLIITMNNGDKIDTSKLFFDNVEQEVDNVSGVSKAVITLSLSPGKYLKQTFSITKNEYTIVSDCEIIGMSGEIENNPIEFVWNDCIKRAEKDITTCRNKTTINYYLDNSKFYNLKETSKQKEEKSIPEHIKWIAIKQRFFTSAVIADQPFDNGLLSISPTVQENIVKEANMNLLLPKINSKEEGHHVKFTFFFGPNDYKVLSKITKGFSKNITLGWPIVRWINQLLVMPVFDILEKYISNYGIIIVLLVFFIKILLLPLSYKSYISSAKMKVLKPALDAIKEKYGKDMQKVQFEQMMLYKEVGINPFSGCIPVLLQLPILLAMFNFIPNTISLRQKSFLWAHDLSSYDSIVQLPFTIPLYGSHVSLFTLLMTASTVLYTFSNSDITSQQKGPMKTMAYIMPFTFMVILNNLPASLSFYYCVSNMVTFVQQFVIKKFVDETVVKEKLEKSKSNPTNIMSKISSFSNRIKAMQEQKNKPKK